MARIRLLPDHLVSQIAAGEVVERPASVVKELVENALDAGASEVRVELEGGGRQRIAVLDDGCGLGRDDSLLAFDRHATSKISTFEDLERVATLGFRGEALAAIASVARVELTTAEQPGDGWRVAIEGGRVRVVEPLSRPRGTSLEVRSLFFNVPARRKFLRAAATELRRALEVVQGYALARPDVAFRLAHEGRVLLDAPAAGATGALARIAQVFGPELAGQLTEIPADSAADGWLPERDATAGAEPAGAPELWRSGWCPVERITGFLGTPATSRGRRQYLFVNRRLLRDRAVLAVFYRSVREAWKTDDFPSLFLFLDLPPEEVDVNVHPQKAEVRFRDPELLDRVALALRRGLDRARGEEAAPLRQPHSGPSMPFAWQGLGEPYPLAWERERAASGEVAEGGPAYGSTSGHPDLGGRPPFGSGADFPGRLATPSYAPIDRPIVPLSGRSGEARPFRLLGQYKGTLILLEGPDGLYLIDQHVAVERILYERLRRALHAERTPVQALLDPPLLDLGPAERLRLAELAPALEECGFGLAELSGGSVALTSVPAVLSIDEAERLLAQLAGEEGGDAGDGAAHDLRRRILDSLAASLACKAAVKMHHVMAPGAMEALVAELFAAEQPYACPHGRPTVLQMTDVDLERRFGRR